MLPSSAAPPSRCTVTAGATTDATIVGTTDATTEACAGNRQAVRATATEHPPITWILIVVIWVALAFWPARVAGRKGHSFFLYFLVSLVFFPAALIVAYMVDDRTQSA